MILLMEFFEMKPFRGTRKELREMFKDDPEILKGMEDLWTIETAVCVGCKEEYPKKTLNQKFCSDSCCRAWHEAKRKWEARIKKAQRKALEIAAEKKYLSEIKTYVCEFCKEEFRQHKKQRARFCSPFCRKAHRKFGLHKWRNQHE